MTSKWSQIQFKNKRQSVDHVAALSSYEGGDELFSGAFRVLRFYDVLILFE